MTDKFKNTYRIPTARWQEWDYGANAAYFVTICTAHMERFFGEIANGEMTLSQIGRTAHDYWQQIPAHFPFVVLDAFVIMPNHVHGIIVIDKPDDDNHAVVPANVPHVHVSAAVPVPVPVQTQNFASLQQQPQPQWQSNKFAPQSKNLASIIRGFKSAVTKFATMNNIPFAWQTRFHDRVIRDNAEHHRIAQYINANIENWQDDELHG
jgi:REP element-mobilizing transposase RayT